MSNKRTQKDEDDYNAHLRRESPVKTEVIQALTRENEDLRRSLVRVLDVLLRDGDALRIYREKVLDYHRGMLARNENALSARYRWDDVDGWHRIEEDQ